MDKLSVFWILFSGFIINNFSIYKLSTNCFFKGSFSNGNISILSLFSIIFKGFYILKIDIWSIFWILFWGFIVLILSIYKSLINCVFKGSFSIGNISK